MSLIVVNLHYNKLLSILRKQIVIILSVAFIYTSDIDQTSLNDFNYLLYKMYIYIYIHIYILLKEQNGLVLKNNYFLKSSMFTSISSQT